MPSGLVKACHHPVGSFADKTDKRGISGVQTVLYRSFVAKPTRLAKICGSMTRGFHA
jgi:hypothetical protein